MISWKLHEIATLIEGALQGDSDIEIRGVASVDEAVEGDIVFAESQKFLQAALRSNASAVITRPDLAQAVTENTKPFVLMETPRLGFMRVLEEFAPKLKTVPGIHPTAVIAQDVEIGEAASIGANVVIEAGSKIGNGVKLLPGVYVGQDCRIGDHTTLFPNVVLYSRVTIGQRCLIHAGVVIGGDGFGFVQVGNTLRKVPHLGGVDIGDEVEIGPNTTIDRAKTSVTRIGSGTKIDNLVQIAHNITIGRSCIIAALTGIAGGVKIGDGVIMAGQSGAKDQVTIGSGARILARGGATSDVPAGATYSEFPARPHSKSLRQWGAVAQLPDALRHIRDLEARLAKLEKQAEGAEE